MNYNALMLLEKKEKQYNLKKKSHPNISINNDFSIYNHRNNYNIIKTNKDNQKYKKCYSVKPSIYMMPKDIYIKDIFHHAMKMSKTSDKLLKKGNISSNSNTDRKYIFEKMKKFISINHINYKILVKTIYLYDLLFYEKEKIENTNNSKFSAFNELPNLSIAIIAFVLTLKFNYEENKTISLKKFVKYFEESDENITFNNVYEMEIVALKLINYNLTFQTPFSFLELFLINGIIFSEDYIYSDLSFKIYELANKTLENIMLNSNEYFNYNYFYLCCSVVMHVREKFKINKWPKPLEITFEVKHEKFNEIYNIFFSKNNKNENENNKSKNKNKIKNIYNFDLINISNLKSMSNIISVLKIIKSADKYRKSNDKLNKMESHNIISNNEKEENSKDNINNNSSCNTIKVGLKKKWNFSSFKSPGKANETKVTVTASTVLTKLNEENKNMFSTLYKKNEIKNNKENENTKNDDDNKNNDKTNDKKDTDYNYKVNNYKDKEEKSIRMTYKKINSDKILKKADFNDIDKNKLNMNKSYNRFKSRIIVNHKNYQEKNNPNINNNNNINININENNFSSVEPNISTSLNLSTYNKRNYINRKNYNLVNSYNEKNKDLKISCQKESNNININSYNLSSKNFSNNKLNNRYANYTEKKRNLELKSETKKLSGLKNNETTMGLNQRKYHDFLFYKNISKNKNNDKDNDNENDNENYYDKYKSKNKEEISNIPTCENSNVRLSINDFSIRKSYRFKKDAKNEEEKLNLSPKNDKNKKFEKEMRKPMEKNKSYNKLTNSKISFSESTYNNRKCGVRKFYKQKNLENH